MNAWFLKENDLGPFLGQLMKTIRVIGPVAKKSRFVFQELASPDDLRLDYDVTILPAKKACFPTRQPLIRFNGNAVSSCIDPVDQVLFGAHFYEIKAIDMLDALFAAGHRDENYLANREHTTIVGSNIQRISPRAFWSSVGAEVEPKGHDAFITKIDGGYVFETRTAKGEALLPFGSFLPAADEQRAAAGQVNREVLDQCPERLQHSAGEIAAKVRESFTDQPLWDALSKDCFSCGTCNIVCPTCYCFDVQDTWNLDQVSGVRARTWDGCLLEDFAQVSLGGGATENFRERHADRFRHRMMRKATYLNNRVGGPACVGCGRCSIGCVPDIADPVHIIDTIMEARG
jgi:sulfhydrogenase subunit beta (sulfur reductase)